MEMIDRTRAAAIGGLFLAAAVLGRAIPPAAAAAAADSLPPYQVEWVYRVKWGHDEEFWQIFQKTQIPVLDKEKELGYVTGYQVFRPGLHTGEESRWNYRVVITYKDLLSSTKGRSLEKQLFPDREAYRKIENRRWELVDAHYDLPIREIDPHAAAD
ncbi:MAG: hypothetical protein WB440_05385 [Steroidobacteraceae bacterium]|jgi:hypothetical protein